MPHIVIEYSKNVTERINIADLVKSVHEAAVATGEFALARVITRASERTCYYVADGDPSNGFIRVVMRILPGRTLETRRRAAEKIFAAMCDFVAPVASSSPLAVSFEMQELTPELSFAKTNLPDYVKARSAKAGQG
jgi:5-carboxymethyl-2-hydroxymuconate isomerase